ncbi:hypothetical protein [Stutzerimonas tarimensis]|uniref:ZIP Zinc transporter n=1 Tax=Stutzerimonas tarimensis TaxID=1507735 RepID=A0ABV7T223_9GAMM
MPALLSAMALTAVHLFAARLGASDRILRSRWLSAAGGVAVAYVFVHLLPGLARSQEVMQRSEVTLLTYVESHAYMLAMIGLLGFYGLERLIKAHRNRLPEHAETHGGVFWLHVVSFALYNGLIGYLLVQDAAGTAETLGWYTVAMGLHFLVNDFGLERAHRDMFRHYGRWVLAAAPLAGWGLGTLTDISDLAVSALAAVIAGGVLLNVLKEELPQEREGHFGAFVLGALGYSALLLGAGA